MSNEIPVLTPEQLQSAREAANKARKARAELKDDIRSGKLSISQALELASKNEVLSRVLVLDLVKTQPRIGDKRAIELLYRLGIAKNRRIRGLGRHQIDALIAEFH